MLEENIKILLPILEIMFKGIDASHDISHLIRTKNLALRIQEKEGGDKFIIAISSLLHDIHRKMSNDEKRYVTPVESLPTVKSVLESTNIPLEEQNMILNCIEHHEEYNFNSIGKKVNDIETLILQDADNLDAIGAIGIARSFSYGGAYGLKLWIPEIPHEYSNYEEVFVDKSTIHHFTHKLLQLKDSMNTETGKQLALHRHNYMKDFVDEFKSEWWSEK